MRFLLDIMLDGEGEVSVIGIDQYSITLGDVIGQDTGGDGILQFTLNDSLEWSGAELRIPASFRQCFHRSIRDLEVKSTGGHSRSKSVELYSHDATEHAAIKLMEHDRFIDSIQQFRAE